jgi:prepilin signal peptidase PulO-like enzyme (type II secretory pathway)
MNVNKFLLYKIAYISGIGLTGLIAKNPSFMHLSVTLSFMLLYPVILTDFEKFYISPKINISFLLGSLTLHSFTQDFAESLYGAFLGISILFAIKICGDLYYKEACMGYGDLLLIGGLGALCTSAIILKGLYFAILLAGIYGGTLKFILRNAQTHLPFAPFLILGTWTAYITKLPCLLN